MIDGRLIALGLVAAVCIAAPLAACGAADEPTFTPAQAGAISATAVAIKECKDIGKQTNSFAAFRRCMCARHERTAADDCVDASIDYVAPDAAQKDVANGDH